MRRVLFMTVLVAMLLGTASVAWADWPEDGPWTSGGAASIVGGYDPDTLGMVWTYNYGGFYPGEEVNVWLYRNRTATWSPTTQLWTSLAWPLDSDPVAAGVQGPKWGTWWWGSSGAGNVNNYMEAPDFPAIAQGNASAYRRQNLSAKCVPLLPGLPCEDPIYINADQFGWYYAKFMHSRDEVWYPCSFPYKWKCNYATSPTTVVFHSPYNVVYDCIGPFQCLTWPWDTALIAGDESPQDTVGPLTAHIQGAGYFFGSPYYVEPYEVLGYSWKWSDVY